MDKRVFIGVCNSQRQMPSEFFWGFVKMANPYPTTIVRSTHPWDVVRNNQLIKVFLRSDFDIFVKMDVDQEYPTDYMTTMVPLVEQYKVIGPLIFDRMPQNGFMPLAFTQYGDQEGHGWKKWDIDGKTGVHEVPYTHTNNFYAREVLEKIPQPWYEAHLTDDGLNRGNHVDYSFLDKIKAAGYPIYLNLDVEVLHDGIGKKDYERAKSG